MIPLWFGIMDPKPNQNSLDFIDSLYDEYLLISFSSSKKFNVGLDEPWELGQGVEQAKGKNTESTKSTLNILREY